MPLASDHTRAVSTFKSTCRNANVSDRSLTYIGITNRLDKAAKQLDKARGDEDLTTAIDAYANQFDAYNSVINGLIRNESAPVGKQLKAARKSFESGVMKIIAAAERQADQQRNAREREEADAERAEANKLDDAVEWFRARRQAHLDDAMDALRQINRIARNADGVRKKARVALKVAETAAGEGNARVAAKAADRVAELANEAQQMGLDAHDIHDGSVKKWQPDRGLNFTHASAEFNLTPDMKKEFVARQRAAVKIFDTARAKGSEALALTKRILKDGEELETMTRQASIAEETGSNAEAMKGTVIDNWTNTNGNTARARLEELITGYKGLDECHYGMNRPLDNVKDHVQRFNNDPGTFHGASYQNALTSLEQQADAVKTAQDKLDRRLDSAIKNIPRELKKDRDLKAVVTEMQRRVSELRKTSIAYQKITTYESKPLEKILRAGPPG